MGQYHFVVNLDKREYLHPHRFGDGLKLMEFGCSGSGTMAALAILLAEDNGRGMGDLHSANPVVGSWARDRIVIAGDYGDPFSENEEPLFFVARDGYEEISEKVMEAMREDEWLRENLEKRRGWLSSLA